MGGSHRTHVIYGVSRQINAAPCGGLKTSLHSPVGGNLTEMRNTAPPQSAKSHTIKQRFKSHLIGAICVNCLLAMYFKSSLIGEAYIIQLLIGVTNIKMKNRKTPKSLAVLRL